MAAVSLGSAAQGKRHVYIYSEALVDCTVPHDVTHVQVIASMIHDHAFYGCSSLVQATISSSSLTVAGPGAFYFCTNLRRVEFPSTLKKIEIDAFTGCNSLDHLQLREGLTDIGHHAFFDCVSLKHISKLPSSLKRIGDEAFASCESLASIELPEGLQEVGAEAFVDCSRLQMAKLTSPHTKMRAGAFSRCSSLMTVELPEGLEVIGKAWFTGCSSLTTINFPLSLNEIQDEAFSECTSLPFLNLPVGLTSIGNSSFARCSSLITVDVPSNVKTMGTDVFSACSSLSSISLPESLEIIDVQAFANCTSLTHVRIPPNVTAIETSAFTSCDKLISLELPPVGLKAFAASNVFGCPFLVNVAFSSALECELVRISSEEVMDDLKLGTPQSNPSELLDKIQHRFDLLPLHRICYYQSYYPLEDTLKELRILRRRDLEADAYEMTPFHILALSRTPSIDILPELFKKYEQNVDILCIRDKFGSTPIDYLCLNFTPEGTALFRSWLPSILGKRLRWIGLERWKSEVLTAVDRTISSVNLSSRKKELQSLYFELASVERVESISLLEVALWQAKFDDYKVEGVKPFKRRRLEHASEAAIDDRKLCRINCGADVVIPNVLSFLGKICREDYTVSGF